MRRWATGLVALAGTLVTATTAIHVRSSRGGIPVPPSASAAAPVPTAHGAVSGAAHARVHRARVRADSFPDDPDAQLTAARVLHDAHQLPEAIERYQAVIVRDSTRRDAWFDLTAAQSAAGRWEDADQTMAAWLAREPGDMEAVFNRGAIAANAGRPALARAYFTAVRDRAQESLRDQAAVSLARLPTP